jgi:hypothetical protein
VNQGRRNDGYAFQFHIYTGSVLLQGYFPLVFGDFDYLVPEKEPEQYKYQQYRQRNKKKKKFKVP